VKSNGTGAVLLAVLGFAAMVLGIACIVWRAAIARGFQKNPLFNSEEQKSDFVRYFGVIAIAFGLCFVAYGLLTI